MKWRFLIPAVAVTASASQPIDVCTAINASSVCMESGMCSNMTRPTWCYTAYNEVSKHSYRLSNESAFILNHRFRNQLMEQAATRLSRGWILRSYFHALPEPTDEFNRNFKVALQDFSNLIQRNFPYIRFLKDDNVVIKSLIAATEALSHDPHLADTTYRESLILGQQISDTREAFRIIIEFISSFSRRDFQRYTFFYNSIPFIHTWIVVHNLLRFPPPFYAPEYMEYLTAAARFDPFHDLDYRNWELTIPKLDADAIATTIPIIDNVGIVPLQLSDYFDIPSDTSMKSTAITSQILSRLGAVPLQGKWMGIWFVKNHPMFTTSNKKIFCDFFINNTIPISKDENPAIQMNMISAMLDLYRLCGDSVLTLDLRINEILPIILQRKNETVGYVVANSSEPTVSDIIRIPLSVLRMRLQITDKIGLRRNVRYLTTFLLQHGDPTKLQYMIRSNPIASDADKQLLEAVGIAVGLLFVDRDPNGLLRSKYPTLLLPYNSFLSGFCKVLNCVAIQALFKPHEIIHILEHFMKQRQTQSL